MRIVHLGFYHRADDVRIYFKECVSLANNGHNVIYITSETINPQLILSSSIQVIQLPLSTKGVSRLKHPFKYFFKIRPIRKFNFESIYDYALSCNADVYHIHEYILLPIAVRLKKKTTAKIVYDVHEDVPRQIDNFSFGCGRLFSLIKKIQAAAIENRENAYAMKFDAIIAATPYIENRFKIINNNIIEVCNYPEINKRNIVNDSSPDNAVCYIGTIFKARGLTQLVEALDTLDICLKIAGNMPDDYKAELERIKGWNKVKLFGYLDRDGVQNLMKSCMAGIVTLLPTANIVNSLPVKLFEYMQAGLPVIASDFPIWRDIVEGNECGICVDPKSPEQIREAIKFIINNIEKAKRMGENGRKAIIKEYNWEKSEKHLLELYSKLDIG